jgi:hypothetical protein
MPLSFHELFKEYEKSKQSNSFDSLFREYQSQKGITAPLGQAPEQYPEPRLTAKPTGQAKKGITAPSGQTNPDDPYAPYTSEFPVRTEDEVNLQNFLRMSQGQPRLKQNSPEAQSLIRKGVEYLTNLFGQQAPPVQMTPEQRARAVVELQARQEGVPMAE